MRYGLQIILGLALLLFVTGCSQVQTPIEAKYYMPLTAGTNQRTFTLDKEIYVSAEAKSGNITLKLFEYNSALALSMSIQNKTFQDIEPNEYSFELFDGRDLKPVKMLSREDLIKIKAKLSGGGSNAIQDQVINVAMTNAMNAVNMPTKDKLIKLMDEAISKSFAFRPIYHREIREGVICFLPNFALEYPLTLIVKINEEKTTFKFLPLPKT
jgi:hypothetical protein